MLRIELIANHSVEENILEAFAAENVGKYYTKFPDVYGVGSAGPRMGDAIWPEVNFVLVIWCEEEEARGIERAVAHVKEHFPDEGIKIFGLPEHAYASAHTAAAVIQAAGGTAFQPSPPPAAPSYTPPPVVPTPPPVVAPVTPVSSPAYTPPVVPPVYAPPAYTPAPVTSAPAHSYYMPPPAPGQVEAEYDGQNMDEEH
jgi:hypothetical protein